LIQTAAGEEEFMESQIITPSLRWQLATRFKDQMSAWQSEKTPCYDRYPSVRILSRLDMDSLVDLCSDVAGLGARLHSERIDALLTADAQDYFERHAWNEFNANQLLWKAVARAWRLPMTRGDMRRAMERLRQECPDQGLLLRIQKEAFRGLSTEEMERAKEFGIIIDALWCPWMESWETINPIFLAD
jgi:hypothetical protein